MEQELMFENISIGIKTFLRDPQLFAAVQGIRENLPGAQIIIADCGEMTEEKDSYYAELEREGHIHIDLPFDSGFGAMGNAIADRLERPLLLVASDDFDFSTPEVRQGIEKLEYALTAPEIDITFDIVSGRVNNRPYEFYLEERASGEWYEVPLGGHQDLIPYSHCDLTVNYSLIRRCVFDTVRWDDDVKIGGGEHGAFFIDCKRAGFKTVYVSGVNINEQQIRNTPRYNLYRRRALNPERPCFVKRGVKRYILGDGTIDYEI
jgi:hypothetical protein